MRIKKAAEAKHEATKSPTTSKLVQDATTSSLVQLLRSLQSYPKPWAEPRGDLYHWIPLLNTFDHILEEVNSQYKLSAGPQTEPFGTKVLVGGFKGEGETRTLSSEGQELRDGENDERLLCMVLDFTRFLLDNCANRSLYNSSEQVNHLLNSTSLRVTVSALHLGARLAATYYRSASTRPQARHSLSTALLTNHYRIDPERVQKLADQFAANLQKSLDGVQNQSQTPSGKGKEVATPARKSAKQTPKIHPNDLLAFVKEPKASQGDFSEFAVVCFDINQGASKAPESQVGESGNVPPTPTPVRRPSGPSRLSRSTGPDETIVQETANTDTQQAHHKLIIQSQVIQNAGIHEILSTNIPKIPSDLHYAFATKVKYAKALCTSAETRRLAVAVRLLALTNIAFLYPENMFQQKVLHQDSTEPKPLQIVYQLAELSKPSSDGVRVVPIDIVAVALEALEAIATRHKSKHSDIVAALGVNITHGTLFQLLRTVVNDLQSEVALDTTSAEIHETIFGMLDNLLPKSEVGRSSRTVDMLVSTGLFGILVEILNIHSEKAQRTQHRVLLFVNEGMHVIREGIQAFANAGGLDSVSELVAWEVKTCLEAVSNGQGLSYGLKSRVMDYEVPIWNQQTLRTVMKLINHMLGHSNATNDRLLRNLIDTPALLRAVNEILRNGKIFGSNIYGQAVTMVSTFINNEPTSYSVIAEAGLSRSLLDSVCGGDSEVKPEEIARRLPINRVAGRDEVTCGQSDDSETLSIARSKDEKLGASILCSSDVIANLPQAFGALCLNSTGMNDFLKSKTLESYFEVFENPAHVKAFVAEPQLAETVGSAFDELVRHHPSLKAAVIYNVIVTIARVDYRCRYLLNPQHPDPKAESKDNQTGSNELNAPLPQDVAMSDNTDTFLPRDVNPDKEPDAIGYVGTLCRFLMTFFNNQNMASTFVDQGGLTFLLDLCSLPSLPTDCIKMHSYSGMSCLAKAVHMVVDNKPQIALPLIVKYSSDALDQVRSLYEYKEEEPYFKGIAAGRLQTPKGDFRALAHLQIYVHLLQEIFSGNVTGRERNLNMFTAINLSDMYVDIIRRLGLLSRFCIWELANVLSDLPREAKSKTDLRLEGYGDEANQVLGIRHSISLRLPTVNGEAGSQEGGSAREQIDNGPQSDTPDDQSVSPKKLSSDQLKIIKVTRHLMTELPRTIFSFFHNLGEKLIPRKRLDPYQRQNAFMVAEAIAQAGVELLNHQRVTPTDRPNRRSSYWTISIEHIRSMLNIGSYFDDPSTPGCSTMLLPAFRNRGGLARLLEMLESSMELVAAGDFDLNKHSNAETPEATATTASANINLILTMLDCLVSSKHVCQTPQASIMQVAGADQGHPFAFSAAQFIVDLRYEILPVVELIWNAKASEKLPPSSRKKMIHILRTILEAEHEHGAARRSSDVVLRESVPHVRFKPSERRNIALDNSYDPEITREAIYRCPGDRERQADYCSLRKLLPLPRFPIPAYDHEPSNNTPSPPTSTAVHLPHPTPRDSQSTIPDAAPPGDSQGSDSTANAQPQNQGDQTESRAPQPSNTEADDPAGRMAMSIDNLLNLSESSQASGATSGPDQAAQEEQNASVPPPSPIEFVLSSTKISLEDLDGLRGPLRKELISRVMDMLAVKDDKLTFDLAELLSTAANKAQTSSAMKETRAEFGETMISSLISFASADDFREQQEHISAIANLLAILLQEKDFYEACVEHLKEHIDGLLDFVRVFPSSEAGEGYPWIGHILLIFEKLLSEELQPEHITWQQPPSDSTAEISTDAIAEYAKPLFTDEQRMKLFENILPVLPHVGKDKSLALSIIRVLVMVTRHRAIVDTLATKDNLRLLFLMIKQLAGQTADKLQSAFMLILRHISENDDTIRKTMRNSILSSFKTSRTGSHQETTAFVRSHYALVLRSPKIFLEVVNEVLKLRNYDANSRPQVLVLKPDVEPEMFTPWEPPTIVTNEKSTEDDSRPEDDVNEVIETTELTGRSEFPEKVKLAVKPPIVEHPGGMIHFLLSQLLLYKDTNDQETLAARPHKTAVNDASGDVEMEINDNTSDDEPAAPHANAPSLSTAPKTELKKEDYKAEEHPIYNFRCFLLQCLTELLMSYNQAKIEFINFSRKADPKAMTPSKPKSGVLNYLLNGLIPVESLERSTSIAAMKRQGTSTWAASVVVALCLRTPETLHETGYGEKEARDSDLLFVRKFVIEHAAKVYRDLHTSSEFSPEVKYARMLSLSDLFNRILIGRTVTIHSTAPKQTGEYVKGQETEVARIMFEKNLISVLTASLSEIDLSITSAKRAVKYILRPLKVLTQTALLYSQNSDLSTTPGQSTEDDDISTATSVSDLSEDREETPDLFRHSALGMLEPGRDEEESSGESEDEDEEMYDDQYDDGLDYDEAMDQVDDDEAVSDPDDDEMGSAGEMEGMPGDMPLNMEVVIDGDEEGSADDDDDDEDSEEESEEDEDDVDDDDMDDMDEDEEIEILDELEHADGDSLDGDNEDEWEDELDDSGDGTDLVHTDVPALIQNSNIFGQIDTMHETVDGPGLGAAGTGAFASLADDVENGTYMNDLRLARDQEEEDEEEDYPEDDEDLEDPDDDEAEEGFMYEEYDGNEDEPFDMMDEAFGFLGGTRSHLPPHFFSRGLGRMPQRGEVIVTPDGQTSMFRTVRTHTRGGPDRHGTEDGINPLLQRNTDAAASLRHRHARTHPFEMSGPTGGLEFLRMMQDSGTHSPGSMMQQVLGSLPGGSGSMWATVRPDDLEILLGHEHRHRDWLTRDHRHQRDDVSQSPPFTPASTITRWQEEARLLYAQTYIEKVNKIMNSLLKLLVPQAMIEAQKQREEDERQAEEDRKKGERLRKEQEERKAKEDEERQAREREEQQRREEEEASVREAAADEQPASDEPAGEAMEGVETAQGEETNNETEQSAAGPSQQAPRVIVTIRGRQMDITDLGIDQDYLEALPAELREEVIMQAVQERRSQQPQTTAVASTSEAPSNVDPAFLDALPEELRQEIIQQEEHAQRRRDRQEQRRREQEAGEAVADDMDIGSVFATLDPVLRRQVLMEQALSGDTDILNQLPEHLRQEARALLEGPEMRNLNLTRRLGQLGQAAGGLPLPAYNRDAAARRAQRKQVVQMLDKPGIATILRLLFVPQTGSLKESLNMILQNLAQNRQSRAELISLLLSILQDGSSDEAAVERSYATLTMRSKQPASQQQTPRALKRTATGGLTAPLGAEMTHMMVIQQCLSALVALVQNNGHAQTFFLNPHETSSSFKTKGKQKGKSKEDGSRKYALNALLSLLDRKLIMENSTCMEQLSQLLIRVTQPLNLLKRLEKEESKTDAAQPDATAESITEATESNESPPQGDDAPSQDQASGNASLAELAKAKESSRTIEPKKSKTPAPPVVPEYNLQLVINIMTAKECSGKVFKDTLATVNNLSAIPGAKQVFLRELVRQAQQLGTAISSDLAELLSQLSKEPGSTVTSAALSKFASGSSDQTKFLRLLMAADWILKPKPTHERSPPIEEDAEAARTHSRMFSSLLMDHPAFNSAWQQLSDCLKSLRDKDNMMNIALILSPLIEALMLCCKHTNAKDAESAMTRSQQLSVASPEPESIMDSLFFRFTEEHRKILNDLVRSNARLMSGNFSMLVNNPKVLDFDNKRNYFTRKMHTRDETRRAHPALSFTVRRGNIFVDSYQKLFFKKPEEVKYGKLNIKFAGEEGVDAGGVGREWFSALTRQFFNQDYALFVPVAADKTTFHPSNFSWVNPEHLHYFKFIGRIIGKALYEGRPLDCHFSRAVYKRILGKQVSVKDMETLDLSSYKSYMWMLENDISEVTFETFSTEQDAFGETQIIDLIPDGRNVAVTNENKQEWIQKIVEYRLTGSVRDQLDSFLQGFHEIVPGEVVSIFNEQELELLISGLPEIDIDDWRANTDYQNFNSNSVQVQWFWRAVRSFDKEERAKLLQFVTGTSKVPLNGFKELEGMNGYSKFNIHRDYGDKDRLPSSHTCFNQLDLPEYDDYETLRSRLYTAMTAGGEYFGFA